MNQNLRLNPYERLRTGTRFETVAKCNSEIAYQWVDSFPRFLEVISSVRKADTHHDERLFSKDEACSDRKCSFQAICTLKNTLIACVSMVH